MLYYEDARFKPNPNKTYIQQWGQVPDGDWLVLRLYKPGKYPAATLVTDGFRVNIPVKQFTLLRETLLEAYEKGSGIFIRTKTGRWELLIDEDKIVDYLADDWGIRAQNFHAEELFYPQLKNDPNETEQANNTKLPF